jgi:hypothetical protein
VDLGGWAAKHGHTIELMSRNTTKAQALDAATHPESAAGPPLNPRIAAGGTGGRPRPALEFRRPSRIEHVPLNHLSISSYSCSSTKVAE